MSLIEFPFNLWSSPCQFFWCRAYAIPVRKEHHPWHARVTKSFAFLNSFSSKGSRHGIQPPRWFAGERSPTQKGLTLARSCHLPRCWVRQRLLGKSSRPKLRGREAWLPVQEEWLLQDVSGSFIMIDDWCYNFFEVSRRASFFLGKMKVCWSTRFIQRKDKHIEKIWMDSGGEATLQPISIPCLVLLLHHLWPRVVPVLGALP